MINFYGVRKFKYDDGGTVKEGYRVEGGFPGASYDEMVSYIDRAMDAARRLKEIDFGNLKFENLEIENKASLYKVIEDESKSIYKFKKVYGKLCKQEYEFNPIDMIIGEIPLYKAEFKDKYRNSVCLSELKSARSSVDKIMDKQINDMGKIEEGKLFYKRIGIDNSQEIEFVSDFILEEKDIFGDGHVIKKCIIKPNKLYCVDFYFCADNIKEVTIKEDGRWVTISNANYETEVISYMELLKKKTIMLKNQIEKETGISISVESAILISGCGVKITNKTKDMIVNEEDFLNIINNCEMPNELVDMEKIKQFLNYEEPKKYEFVSYKSILDSTIPLMERYIEILEIYDKHVCSVRNYNHGKNRERGERHWFRNLLWCFIIIFIIILLID